nr:uncharacterized protein LOC112711534 [Arachis hypogaea]
MKYPSVHGSNFIRFSILIHPSLNSNTLNKGTPQPIEALTSRTPTRTAQLASHSGSLEAAGRSGVSVFWPIFSAPMARKGRFTKKPKIGPGCQQPQMALPPVSASHHDDSQILPNSGDSVPATSCPFLPPHSVPRPTPQTSTNNIQNSEPSHVNSTYNANDVDSVDQEADDSFVDSRAQNHKGRKTTEFWKVRIIDNVF